MKKLSMLGIVVGAALLTAATTAKALGLTVPHPLLITADEVIE